MSQEAINPLLLDERNYGDEFGPRNAERIPMNPNKAYPGYCLALASLFSVLALLVMALMLLVKLGDFTMAGSEETHMECENNTGEPCLVYGCGTEHGPRHCVDGMCLCANSTCAFEDRICRPAIEALVFPVTGPEWVRKNVHYVYYAAPFAMILRVSKAIWPLFFRRLCCGDGTSTFKFEGSTWRSEMNARGLKGTCGWLVAIVIAVINLFFCHLAQPIGFLSAWYAYSPFLGRVQWVYGLLVSMREMAYLSLIILCTFMTPHFLLFCPRTEKNIGKVTWFFACPQALLAACAFGVNESELAWMLVAFPSAVADLASLVALFMGLVGYGAMFPAIGAGYCLAFFSVAGFFAVEAEDARDVPRRYLVQPQDAAALRDPSTL